MYIMNAMNQNVINKITEFKKKIKIKAKIISVLLIWVIL